jgi:DNA adenine methylase
MNSPIKYFGGKNGFANKIIDYLPNNYKDMIYVEPFCGSAAILFHKNRSQVEIINDIDNNIAIIQNKQNKLKQQKQGMMQALLTGKIRLV